MTEDTKQKIESARGLIQSLMKEQEDLYYHLSRELGDDIDTNLEDYVWDYCFSCPMDSSNEYTQRIRRIIYEDGEE